MADPFLRSGGSAMEHMQLKQVESAFGKADYDKETVQCLLRLLQCSHTPAVLQSAEVLYPD